MTLLHFVLKLRRRLQDLRTLTGVVIEDLNSDGMRWASSELVDIVNDAITELTRIIATYSNSPIMKQIADVHTVSKGILSITNGMSLELDSSITAITELINANNEQYAWIKPATYFDYLSDTSSPRYGEKFFTILKESNGDRRIYLMPSASFVANVTYIYSKTYIKSVDSDSIVGYNGLEDLLLDLAEREARDREHNWSRSQILDNRIAIKLGVSIK